MLAVRSYWIFFAIILLGSQTFAEGTKVYSARVVSPKSANLPSEIKFTYDSITAKNEEKKDEEFYKIKPVVKDSICVNSKSTSSEYPIPNKENPLVYATMQVIDGKGSCLQSIRVSAEHDGIQDAISYLMDQETSTPLDLAIISLLHGCQQAIVLK